MLVLSFNCRRRRRDVSIFWAATLIQLIHISYADERSINGGSRVAQAFPPGGAQSLDDENAAQLDALEAQLRAEMRVTAPPTFNYGQYPYNLAFPSVPSVPFTTTSTQNSLWNPFGRPAPFAVAYGAQTRTANTNTPLNFDMIENRERSSKFVDADVQGVQGAKSFDSSTGPLIDSNIVGETLPATVNPLVDVPAGENMFVDALKQVLVNFKRGMMNGKYGTELQHKAERLNQHANPHRQHPNGRLVDSAIGSRPYLALRQKWEANAVNGRFGGPRAVDGAESEFRRKPAAIRQLYPTYTVLPSRLAN